MKEISRDGPKWPALQLKLGECERGVKKVIESKVDRDGSKWSAPAKVVKIMFVVREVKQRKVK